MEVKCPFCVMDGLPDDDKEFAADNLYKNEPSFGDMVMCDDKCTDCTLPTKSPSCRKLSKLSGRKKLNQITASLSCMLFYLYFSMRLYYPKKIVHI